MGALNEKLAALGHGLPPPDLPHIYLAKRRARCQGPRCTFEETDVVVRYCAADSTEPHDTTAGDGASLGPSEEVWRSVAVEGKRKACATLQATLLPRVAAAAGPEARVLVCGYAEFVAIMAAQRGTAAAAGNGDAPGVVHTSSDALGAK